VKNAIKTLQSAPERHAPNLLAAPDSAELTRAKQRLTEVRETLEHRRQALRDLPPGDSRRALYQARVKQTESDEAAALLEVLTLRAEALPSHISMCRLRLEIALDDMRQTRERLAAPTSRSVSY
jgi:hypothetical protein